MVGFFTDIVLRGLPTRDDRLQEDRMLVLDERHQVHVILTLDDEDTLARVTLGVRVIEDVQQVPALDVEDDVLEPDAALRPELRVLRVVPGEVLHYRKDNTAVCLVGTHWRRRQYAQECAQTRSEAGHPSANANERSNKKRA